MNYLLFTFFLALGTYLITRISFVRNTGLPVKMIAALFLLKIFAGLFLGWMSQKFYPLNDYWYINDEGLKEFKLMLSDPKEFITNIFKSPYQNAYDGFFNSVGSYWNDLKNNIIIKLVAFCDIFSRGNYYINSLFFNFFGFFGNVALYRVFKDIYYNKKWALVTGCFLLPSVVYFSSGIHKDLIIFTMLGCYSYCLYFSMKERFTAKRIVVIFLTLSAILLIRNFVLIAIIPATIALLFTGKKNKKALIIFTGTYISCFLLIVILQIIVPSFEPLKIITQKQHDFFDLPIAASQLQTNTLEPNLKSLIRNTPQAFNHGFLRPYLWECKGTFLLPLAVELMIYELLFLIMVFWNRPVFLTDQSFILFSLFFSISMLLITGFIIPNTGSIVRYKSIYLPFLITPILCSINWGKSKKQINIL